MKLASTLAAALLFAATAAGTAAQEVKVGDIAVEQAWARASATSQAKTAAAYLTIRNDGAVVDRLVGGASDISERTELHTHSMDDGVMRMRRVEAIEVNPGEPSVLQPGGLHIMFMGLKAPLSEGETFMLTLRFETAGEIAVPVHVMGVAAGHGGHGNHGGHKIN